MAAVRCATDEQLNTIIDNIGQIDSSSRAQLFRQLIAMEHPRCPELLKQSLEGNESEFGMALRHLPIGTSPEMLQLVINRYERFLQTASDHGELDTTAFRMAQQLLRRLIQIDHPEARRMINRSLISPVPGLREEAGQQQAANVNRSRTRRQKRDIWALKRDRKYAEALEKVNALLEQDPFCADFLMLRASLNLRDNRIESAYADVVEASRLSPGDVITESTIALLQVRSGKIQQGLNYAEAVMKQVPSTAGTYYGWTLYNTACVYGRAIEQQDVSAEDQKQYLDRAIVLMHQAAGAGISDVTHLLADPDLVTLHEHAEWPAIVEQITTNKEK
jgi:tetratricopeptide (TPR) repeat protein